MTHVGARERTDEAMETGVWPRERPAGGGWRRFFDWFQKPDTTREVGPYRLVEKIGQGGMGVVYRATHPETSRPLALKLLHSRRARKQDVERFEREARLTRLFRHPNTVSAYDAGKTPDGAPYLVMEYVAGRDLQTLVRSEGPLSPARVAGIIAQVAAALVEVHGRGVIHGDLKPANVVLCDGEPGDRVKVLDFGLARELEPADAPSAAAPRVIAGTPLYLSPEVLLGRDRVDGRSDLYALGVLAYFLLTGSPPFSGKSALEVCIQHLEEAPVPASERCPGRVPPELDALITSCLAKSPNDRPANAELVRDAALSIARPKRSGAL